jgi:hypothetical protein
MCLIIDRPANKELDFEKFKTAVLNNPHGYGISAAHGDGKLTTLRSHIEPDPEKLFKFIEDEFFEQDTLIHLRYTTVGKTILRNAHPFPILEYDTDGVDLRMAHNGTLYNYKEKNGLSDTRQFVAEFVRPLFKRMRRGFEIEEILDDEWVFDQLNDKLPAKSVLCFIDGYGNSLRVNAEGNGGKEEGDVYYSNTYSFNPDHRLPSKNVVQGVGYWQNQQIRGNTTPKPHAEDTKVEKFTDKFGITEDEFVEINDAFIDELVEQHPEDSKLFIKELLFFNEIHRETIERLKRKLEQ